MPARTLSNSDASTLNSISTYDMMDPEVRLQIQSNIRVLYEPNVASMINIATSRSQDGVCLAFLVKQDNLAKALTTASTISGQPKPSRSAAMTSLLEATEQRIFEMLSQTPSVRSNSKKSNSSIHEPRIMYMPTADRPASDYGEKPKEREKSFKLWKNSSRHDHPNYARGETID